MPSATTLQRVDIQAGIGFVENRQSRLQQRHLQDLVALLLAAGEADIQRALQHVLGDTEFVALGADQLEELHGVQFRLPAMLADGIERRLQEIVAADAGDLDRILEGEEDAFARPLFGVQFQQVLALILSCDPSVTS